MITKLGEYLHENEKKAIMIHEAKLGFFYITFESSSKIIEWFVIESAAKKYCEVNYSKVKK